MMDFITKQSFEALGDAGSTLAVEAIKKAHASGRPATVLLAAAPSQLPVLRALARADIHNDPIHYFHMDEYVGLPKGASQSFGQWLESNYFSLLPKENQAVFHRISPQGEPADVASSYAKSLPSNEFDLVLCGIGTNGHLAFNDPGTKFDTPSSVLHIELAEASRTQQVDEGHFSNLNAVPKFAITLTVPRILKSAAIVCSVLGTPKAQAVRDVINGQVTDQVPASALKNHTNATVLTDLEAAQLVNQEV